MELAVLIERNLFMKPASIVCAVVLAIAVVVIACVWRGDALLHMWAGLGVKNQVAVLGPLAVVLAATTAFLGAIWQFQKSKAKEIAFRIQEQQKEKYEGLINSLVAVFAHAGDMGSITTGGEAPVDSFGVLGITREQWMSANIDLGLYASEKFLHMFGEYQRGLLLNDDYYISARRMGELFLQIRKDVGLASTGVTARDVITTFVTDIHESRYDYAFRGDFPCGRHPSRPTAEVPPGDQESVETYLALVLPAKEVLDRCQERIGGLDLANFLENTDEADTGPLIDEVSAVIEDIDTVAQIFRTVAVPVSAQHVQQLYVGLCNEWLGAMKLLLEGLRRRNNEAVGVGLDRFSRTEPTMMDLLYAGTALRAGVPTAELTDWLHRMATVTSPAENPTKNLRSENRSQRRAAGKRNRGAAAGQ